MRCQDCYDLLVHTRKCKIVEAITNSSYMSCDFGQMLWLKCIQFQTKIKTITHSEVILVGWIKWYDFYEDVSPGLH